MDKYKILEQLAETENSAVYLVMNTENHRVLVMKKIKQGSTEPYENVIGMQNEHIVRVYEVYGDTIIMEYIAGTPLSEIGRCVQEYEVRDWMLQLCDAVGALHKNGIIHRDIKPSNIMITDDGVIKLIDLDIARTYKSYRGKDTRNLGTDGYAPPEQYGFAQTDMRTDIYAIGVVMYELLSGGKPVSTINEYRGLLKPVIKKCTSLAPQERYQSVEALEAALGGRQRENLPGSDVKWYRNRKNFIAMLLTAVLCLASVIGVFIRINAMNSVSGGNINITIDSGAYDENSTPIGISSMRLEETGDLFEKRLQIYARVYNKTESPGATVKLEFEMFDDDGVSLGFEYVSGYVSVNDGSLFKQKLGAVNKRGIYIYNGRAVSTIRLIKVEAY